jgi:uncharacterized protein
MSSGPFPDRVDASKLFARHGRIESSLSLSRLTRLADYLADSSGQAEVVLEFGHDAEGRKQITGSIEAEVQLACQRCLQAMPMQVSCELSLLVYATRAELEKQLSAQGRALESMDQDVLVLDELPDATQDKAESKAESKAEKDTAVKSGRHPEKLLEQNLDVLSLVEDELILSMPLVPLHEDVNCSRAFNQRRLQDSEGASQDARDSSEGAGNPFAILAKLKSGADKPH